MDWAETEAKRKAMTSGWNTSDHKTTSSFQHFLFPFCLMYLSFLSLVCLLFGEGWVFGDCDQERLVFFGGSFLVLCNEEHLGNTMPELWVKLTSLCSAVMHCVKLMLVQLSWICWAVFFLLKKLFQSSELCFKFWLEVLPYFSLAFSVIGCV